MPPYVPPMRAFAPAELAIMKDALEAAWDEIKATSLIDIPKDEALKRALSLKLFSLVRQRPFDSASVREILLMSLRADSEDGDEHAR